VLGNAQRFDRRGPKAGFVLDEEAGSNWKPLQFLARRPSLGQLAPLRELLDDAVDLNGGQLVRGYSTTLRMGSAGDLARPVDRSPRTPPIQRDQPDFRLGWPAKWRSANAQTAAGKYQPKR
jgi:hypothetical protein